MKQMLSRPEPRRRKPIKKPCGQGRSEFRRDTAAVLGKNRFAIGQQVSREAVMRSQIIAAFTIAALLATFVTSAEARGGGHGFGRGFSGHGAQFGSGVGPRSGASCHQGL